MSGAHRVPAGWFRRPERGRPEQPPGRHTPEYLASVAAGVGMYPLGEPGRVTFSQHHGHTAQDVATDDRGDRFSHRPTKG